MKKYTRSISIAVFICFIDSFVYSQGGIALLTVIIAMVILIPKILIALVKKNSQLCKQRIVIAGIYLLMAIMVFTAISMNNKLASKRADRLILACNSYKEKYQKYPDTLENLVPEFISRVPKAKFALSYSEFMYISRKDSHLLVYYAAPPFGRWVYKMETKSWGYLD
ncbi:MAG: hypothetical protein HQ594_03095 [Candidatus Omnitrophica bacterium]|nr:hypothetical protein [Candidatus Omnitrophota bacterium]